MTEFRDKVSVLVRYSSLLIGALGPVLDIVGPLPIPNPAGPRAPAATAPPFRPPFKDLPMLDTPAFAANPFLSSYVGKVAQAAEAGSSDHVEVWASP